MRAFSLALAAGLALHLSTSVQAAADLRFFDDAPLQAVQFINPQEGWAVGDEGVVWKTIDGGKTWERMPTGTRASLRDLHFVNALFGWVVGREELPHGGGSVGVLLFTRDGGCSWQKLLENALPGLNRVRFVDAKTGFLFGDGTDQFPSGVFKTPDGGRSWEPLAGPRATSWLAGTFTDEPAGILVGAWSRLGKIRGDNFAVGNVKELVDDLGGRSLRGVVWLDKRALAVGQGGLVLISESGGSGWGFANLNLSLDLLQTLDFHAIHGLGTRAWAVGRPGSVVLHTPDQGKTWKVQKTGQHLPLNGTFFRDELHGWAVGEAGTIVATTDGGHTWKVQRQGGKRAALLFVQARGEDLPLDALAQLGAEEGYLAAGLRVLGPDPLSAAPRHITDPQRWARALRQVGGLAGEGCWQFPTPQHLAHGDKTQLLRFWNQLHNPKNRPDVPDSGQLLLRQLVLALRMWRPEVAVTDAADAKTAPHAAGLLVAETLGEAVRRAADPKAFPEQIETLGLTAWQTARVYALEEKTQTAHVVMDGHQARARLEATPRAFAAPAAGLLHDRPCVLPGQRGFRLLDSRTPQAANDRHLISSASDDARRRLPPHEEKDDVLKAIRARRHLESLAENLTEPRQANQALGQLLPALAQLPDDQGAAAAFAIASHYARQGQWLLARETFLLLIDRYPAHAQAADAYRWLIRHASSSEARRRQELGQFYLVTQTGFQQKGNPSDIVPASTLPAKPGIFAVTGQPEDPKTNGDRPTIGSTQLVRHGKGVYLSDKEESRRWSHGSLEFGKRLARLGSVHFTDPSIQFCLQASRRQLGEFGEVQKWFTKFKEHFPRGPWADAAAAELWLTQGGPTPPKILGVCRFTEQKPFLDGVLDDPCWQGVKPLVPVNAVGDTVKEYPTEALFAYDQEFLYLALRCKHPVGKKVDPVQRRQRDADLRPFDRVSILLDLDRDYATYFHLQVDQRGCVREDCWGDPGWNPRWFVAVKSTGDGWTVEAALPLGELTGNRLTQATAWACNIVRILPGRGVQGWSLPADVEPRPEGLGLLLFRGK